MGKQGQNGIACGWENTSVWTTLFMQLGALVLVDGAHAVGSLPDLDVPSIRADFYTTNL